MLIRLLVVGKTNESYLEVGIEEYSKRISRYNKFEFDVIPDIKNGHKLSHKDLKEKEGKEILKRSEKSKLVLLDDKGKQFTSEDFAKYISKQIMDATKSITFVVGGAFGFSSEVYESAQGKISLSKMTLTHQMIRLFFVEQVYRGFTIIGGEKYHHV